MKAREIFMRAEMVRALIDGTKTQTRRLITIDEWRRAGRADHAQDVFCSDGRWTYADTRDGLVEMRAPQCRYGGPGDLLWVRETHYVWSAGYRDGSGRRIVYRASEPDAPCTWTPSIHMPRWASRLTLKLTEVRAERLTEISPEDAAAEGWPGPDEQNSIRSAYPIAWYSHLWEQINGAGSWALNPWVWALTFTVEKRNVDELLEVAA